MRSGRPVAKRASGWIAVSLVLLVALSLLWPGIAQGHAVLRSADPGFDEVLGSAPEDVTLNFTEPVELGFGSVRVLDQEGRRVDRGEAGYVSGRQDSISVRLEPALADGVYTVDWRVISSDSHPLGGAFVFYVGKAGVAAGGGVLPYREAPLGGPAAVAFGVVRWVIFCALLVLAGASIFYVAVWRRPAGGMAAMAPAVEERFQARWRAIVAGAWIAAFVATMLSLPFQGALAGRVSLVSAFSPSVLGNVATTTYGQIALLRLLLLGLALAAALWLGRRYSTAAGGTRALEARTSVGAAATYPGSRPAALAAGAVLLLVLLATPGLAGHAASSSPVALNVGLDVLHVAGAAAWIGGLVTLVFSAFPSVTLLSSEERALALAPIVSRFSRLALGAVAVITLTGTLRAWMEVGGLEALTGSSYGWTLLAKVGVFLPLVGLGAFNQRWAKPRLEGATGENALAVLRRSVGIEVAIAAVVIGLTALLVNLPPGEVSALADSPLTTTVAFGDLELDVLVDPNLAGANSVHLTAVTASGDPAPVAAMRVKFSMPERSIGPLLGDGRRLARGHFVVEGRQLSLPGLWELTIVGRTGRFQQERATVELEVGNDR